MKLKERDNFLWEVHEFDSERNLKAWLRMKWKEGGFIPNDVLFKGKLSDVTEEQAKEWVEIGDVPAIWHKDYQANTFTIPFALQSLKSAVSKSWIIVTKTKI